MKPFIYALSACLSLTQFAHAAVNADDLLPRISTGPRPYIIAVDGRSGSEHDRQSMYLLMQSHQRLGNCESVINIGNRYISRFRNSSEAADAMFSIGQCQWNMQQRDVARDTWRKLMVIYPDSAAAKKAAKHADKY